MFEPIRFVCFNDDGKSFMCALPSQYCAYEYRPFKMFLSKSDPRRSVSLGATCSGYQFFAIFGPSGNSQFNSKQVCVIDHTQDQVLYDVSFPQSVLAIRASPQMVFLAFYDHVEIVNFHKGSCVDGLSALPNVYAPLDM
jgi:hypothetical protein